MLSMRVMTAADIPFGMQLKLQAKWNQTASDWIRFLALHPEGCFVSLLDEEPIGTIVAARSNRVAWIAMLLVDERHRGKGIGSYMLKAVIHDLELQGARTIRLDATPQGQPLYERLGFHADYEIYRMEGRQRRYARSNIDIPVFSAESNERHSLFTSLSRIIELDHRITGEDRSRLLTYLASANETQWYWIFDQNSLGGFCVVRPGAISPFIGPLIAEKDWIAVALLAQATRGLHDKSILLDVPHIHSSNPGWNGSLDLVPLRSFVRMYRGEQVVSQPRSIWSTSGPEFG